MLCIYVCVGSACHIKGSYSIINQLQQLIEERGLGEKVEIKAALCLGNCTNAVSAKVEDGEVVSLSKSNLVSFFEEEVVKKLNL